MKHEQFKLMAEIMEKIDNQSRLPVPRSVGMPTVDAEVIALIQKTYQEQNMPVTPEQINKAVEEVKKTYEPIQGLDYLLQFKQGETRWFSKKFKGLARITPGITVTEPWAMESAQTIKHMLNYGLNVRPYSSRDRLRYVNELLKMKRLNPLFLMASGSLLFGCVMLLKSWPFWGSGVLAITGAVTGLALFGLSIWAFINRIDLKFMLKELEKENPAYAEAFHHEFAFDFHKEIRRSKPSAAALNSFFDGVYIPSAPLVWNHESQSVLKQIARNKNIGKIVDLWNEEGVAWRQQDFWFFVVLGSHMEVLPSHHWLGV